MSGKFKHTSQVILAKQVLEFIDWQLERTEQQKMVEDMLGSLEQNMGRMPSNGARVLNTMQVSRLRADALQVERKQVVGGGIGSSFKRLNPAR